MRGSVTEQQLHRAVAEYLDMVLPPYSAWTTIGHGGGGKIRGAQLKAMGVKPGWPDIHILAGTAYYIELKTPKGRVSDKQKAVMDAIWNAGGEWAVCRSVDDVADTLKGWGLA